MAPPRSYPKNASDIIRLMHPLPNRIVHFGVRSHVGQTPEAVPIFEVGLAAFRSRVAPNSKIDADVVAQFNDMNILLTTALDTASRKRKK